MARKQGTIHALRINAAQVLTPRSAFVIFLFIGKPSLYIFHNWAGIRATPPPVFHSPLPHILNRGRDLSLSRGGHRYDFPTFR